MSCCMLPEKYVKSFYKQFSRVGIEPEFDIIEEMLYEIGRAGIEPEKATALRYCKMGDKKSFEAFKNLEGIGLGKVWEHQIKRGNRTILMACNYKD